jgi:PEP-CTERM motif
MKKILLLIFGFMQVIGAFAQGTIYFANNPQFPVYTNNTIGNYGNAPQNNFHVALYWGIAGSTEAQLVQIGPTVGGVADGIFNGGVYTTPNGTAPGANAMFEVKGWTGNYNTYEAALAAAAYDSSIQTDTSGAWLNPTGSSAGNPAPMIFGPSGFNCLFLASLTSVPEPSTLVLAGAGGIMMMAMIRRRKK